MLLPQFPTQLPMVLRISLKYWHKVTSYLFKAGIFQVAMPRSLARLTIARRQFSKAWTRRAIGKRRTTRLLVRVLAFFGLFFLGCLGSLTVAVRANGIGLEGLPAQGWFSPWLDRPAAVASLPPAPPDKPSSAPSSTFPALFPASATPAAKPAIATPDGNFSTPSLIPFTPKRLSHHHVATTNDMQTAASLVEQGLLAYQAGQFRAAITSWKAALAQALSAADQAIIYSNLATAYQQVGQPEEAASAWANALSYYEDQPDSELQQARVLVEQAQAYDAMGQHRRAIRILESAQGLAEASEDTETIAAARGAMGNALWASGDYEAAIEAHQRSLDLAQESRNNLFVSIAYNNLGNVYESQVQRYQYQLAVAKAEGEVLEIRDLEAKLAQGIQNAVSAAENSVETSHQLGGMVEIRALLNLNRILTDLDVEATRPQDRVVRLQANQNRILQLLHQEPSSREKAFALINAAVSLVSIDAATEPIAPASVNRQVLTQQAELLREAILIARNIEDLRAESFALGSLGSLYEQQGAYADAMELTRQAQFTAQQVDAIDSLYRWQWQAGRIQVATQANDLAINSYREAVKSLQSIRSDIVAANKDLQFDFRDTVEPVYRQLISLLLAQPAAGEQKQANIKEVLNVLELLKLAELQNFFGDDCVDVAKSIVDQDGRLADDQATVIYSVILSDRTELLVQFADGKLTQHTIALNESDIQTEVDEFRRLLEKRGTNEYLSYAQSLYRRLITPILPDLELAKPQTLVFIQDGVLRKIPMSALHDGEHFLIEKFAITTTPSLTLTSQSILDKKNTQALILGLTVESPPFAALTNVNEEVQKVQNIIGGKVLLDDQFTLDRFSQELSDDDYSIVHLATHGKFGVDNDTTFLVAFDQHITIDTLDVLLRSRNIQTGNVRRQPIELLTLSACQTAAGDNRAALGIAGVAVRAGARSALASLWFINDASTTTLIESFYQELAKDNVTKAEALRQAQIAAINNYENEHPGVWSPFILIGNWL